SIYYIIWAFIAIGSIADVSFEKWQDKRALNLFLCIVASLFCGLRFECDNDFTAYVGHWLNLPYFSDGDFSYVFGKFSSIKLEFGYKLVAVILKNIGFAPQAMFVFCSVVTFYLFYKVTPYFTRYPNLALFLFFSQFIVLPFMQIRFGVCAMLIWYSFYKWDKHQKWKAVLFFIFAISFHNLAFVVLLLLPLLKLKMKYLIGVLVVVLFMPLHLVSDFALAAVILMGWNYGDYFEDSATLSFVSYFLNFVLVLPLIIIAFYKKNYFNGIEKNLIKYYILFLIGFTLSMNLSIIARIAIVFSISICFLLPEYLRMVKEKSVYKALILVGIILYGLMKYMPWLQYYKPYNFNLELI
ncbi:MAG: EpsG family protein, partial [Muribaculaceae bacterium]|nr:EpsG family protein [Muribaculaceae bacterium]